MKGPAAARFQHPILLNPPPSGISVPDAPRRGRPERKEPPHDPHHHAHRRGRTVTAYHGIVFGEVIAGVNMFRDIAAGFRNLVGGRSGSYETELMNAREEAQKELSERAEELGANAVVGIDVDYETLGSDNGMLMVTASGTAVTIS